MKIRGLVGRDMDTLYQLKTEFYPDENFPDFNQCGPVTLITDDFGEIITAGGVELIGEAHAITNKSYSSLIRCRALKLLLGSILSSYGLKTLHAMVQNDPTWIRTLESVGFKQLDGKTLYIEVKNGRT